MTITKELIIRTKPRRNEELTIHSDISPLLYSVQIGQHYSNTIDSIHKKSHGQYFTPAEIARFMAEKLTITKSNIKILDPGFGTGNLTSALIEQISKFKEVKNIELIAYENDEKLNNYSNQVLEYISKWVSANNIKFDYELRTKDFIIDNENKLHHQDLIFENSKDECYDIIIANPPYFKLSIEDERAKLAKDIINGHPNIYAIFLYLSLKMLKEDGEYVFIVPRGFASGQYFKLFRERFFEIAKLEWIHIFDSRRKPFDKENVLQENIIIKGSKKSNHNVSDNVFVSNSNDYKDLKASTVKKYKLNDIINMKSQQKILHIPINDKEENILNIFKKWDGSLNKYHLQISTGPIVSFRAINYISPIKKDNTYIPLYNLHNVFQMTFKHPLPKNGKAQYIKYCEETSPIILKNRNYVFLRRFSTKDDQKRLIATPYFMDITQSEFIGIENHLNYIYKVDGEMERNLVLGISALLNSEIYDKYFRIFNGNINVSATELRTMTFPPLEEIKEIGDKIIIDNNFLTTNYDELIKTILSFEKYSELDYE